MIGALSLYVVALNERVITMSYYCERWCKCNKASDHWRQLAL